MMMDDGDVGDNWSYKTWKASAANVSILDFIGAKDDRNGGDNWSYKTCKAPVDKPTPIALGQLTSIILSSNNIRNGDVLVPANTWKMAVKTETERSLALVRNFCDTKAVT